MKVKEVSISANIAWSPENVSSIYLACGTSAQQLDASFNSSSVLQIYDLQPSNPSLNMKLVATKNVPAKFNKIVWNGKQVGTFNQPSGIIAGGCENGSVYLYSPDKLMKNEESLLTYFEGKSPGPVYTLDFNHFQANLLATGSTDCDISIWDINNTSSPMIPGAKPNMSADVTTVAWNNQVQHILASTYAGRCVVYDVKKGASIIQIAESVSRIRANSVKWHPTVSTQLILGSDDDNAPFGQVWDLRFASAPLKSLEGHQRGIATSAWCSADPDLFLTSGKDNKIFVWNPNNNDKLAEIVGEFPSYNQWSFDISWCLKDPSLVAAASVDGAVSVYSIIGAGIPPSQNNKFSAIADSFPGMEMPVEVPQTVQPQSIYLRRPPKWFPKRCGACFGFGGRLLSWSFSDRCVSISQVITEPEFVSRSAKLEEALSSQDLPGFCHSKIQATDVSHEKTLWNFIGATFHSSARRSYMSLLGFTPDQVAAKVRPQDLTVNPEELAEKMAHLGPYGQEGSTDSLDPSEQFELIASSQSIDKTPEVELDSNFECIPNEPISLSIGDDPQGMIRHALLVGDYESAVQLCLKEKKNSLALVLAAHAGSELFQKTREKVLRSEPQSGLSAIVNSVVQRDLYSLVSKCQLADWKEALVAVLTYSTEEEFTPLAECLGLRLESEGSLDRLQCAVLCFLCAGNLDKFILCLTKAEPNFSNGGPLNLQNLIEIIVVLERALSSVGRLPTSKEGSCASAYLSKYAALLASQGALSIAASYLSNPSEGDMVDLKDRLHRALGHPTGASLAARNRCVSASSQHSIRRSSTPMPYQPAQYAPSAQAQHPMYGTPAQIPSYANPSLPKQMPPMPPFAQPTAVVPPSYGGMPAVASPSIPFQPNLMSPSVSSPAVTGPSSFRRPNTFGRQEPLHLPPPQISSFEVSPQRGPFTPASIPPPPIPQNIQQSTDHFSHFNSPSAPITPSAAAFGMPPHPPYCNAPNSFMPEPSEAIGNPVTPAAYDSSIPRGWNDPPLLSSTRKLDESLSGSSFMGEHSGAKRLQNLKSKQRQKSQSEDTPTAPPPGVMVPEPLPQQHQQFPGFQQSLQGHQTGVEAKEYASMTSQAAAAAAAPPPPPPKGPLPPEHQIIQEVFNRLREKSMQVTTNSAAKQRLDDLSVQLEILYDRLREGQIGAKTVEGLHQIVVAVKMGDYHHALQLQTATITSGNFSEMSQFMPAIRKLLTTCMQCQVFYS